MPYFEGTPIPTSLVLVILLAVAASSGHIGDTLWWGQWQLGPWQLHPLVLLFAVSGSLMISKTLRIPNPERHTATHAVGWLGRGHWMG